VSVDIIQGDCREVLASLPSGIAQTCVTSPPYFGLRDYGTGQWDGGDSGCAHRVGGQVADSKAAGAIAGGVRPGVDARRCLDCGALRQDSQIGLELTPTDYVAEVVKVFREVRRVLRDDGTLWLNLGDSYAGSWGAQGNDLSGSASDYQRGAMPRVGSHAGSIREPGLKPKDLIGVPWMVAFALRADGWWLRQEIIWSKTNPMPESMGDRCTKAHEQLFLLSKRPDYYFDQAAIAETSVYQPGSRPEVKQGGFNSKYASHGVVPGGRDRGEAFRAVRETRNKRSVWTTPTAQYAEAHFATYPPELIEPCILAGAPPGGLVLDPFGGAGTTGLTANRLGRDAILIELNTESIELARARIDQDMPLHARVAVV
jgi:DNA modification methylase